MNNLTKVETITSLKLLEEINFFRKQEGGRAELQHKTLLEIIRDEFEEEIGEKNILPTSTYKDSQGKDRPMFVLTIQQGKQVLVRESKFVRKAVIKKLDELINSEESLIKNLIFDIYKGGQVAIESSRKLTEIEVNKAVAPLQLDITHKTKIIDNLTQDLDGTVLRVIVTDYVNKINHETGRHQSELYSEIYKLVGRSLKKDLKVQYENFKKSEEKKVSENRDYNIANKLKGENAKFPNKLKDCKYKISMVEYICDILGEGTLLIEVMAKLFEVGMDEIISKYNLKKERGVI